MRNIFTKYILIIAFSLYCFLPFRAEAQNEMGRPVTGIYSIEIGSEQVLCTYLSPLKYTGKKVGISGEWSKAMPFNPENAIMEFDFNGNFSNLLNPAQTAQMLGINCAFSWGMSWRQRLPYDFQVTAGGAVGIEGGAYYLIRNSNNPVQAIANASLNIRASLSKHFVIGKLPLLVRESVSLPSIGLFFCPEFGETYYEIYLGNHKGLAHPGWWGNNFRIDNLLSVTLDFGRTSMTLGYRFKAYTQWSNNINTKIFSNSFVIGVVPGGIGLKNKLKSLPDDKIYSLY